MSHFDSQTHSSTSYDELSKSGALLSKLHITKTQKIRIIFPSTKI